MMLGTVKCFDTVYGTGFISPDDGSKDAYILSAIIEGAGLQELQTGQRVAFELRNSASRIIRHLHVLAEESKYIPN